MTAGGTKSATFTRRVRLVAPVPFTTKLFHLSDRTVPRALLLLAVDTGVIDYQSDCPEMDQVVCYGSNCVEKSCSQWQRLRDDRERNLGTQYKQVDL